jgi:3-oxoacyl-[acyl-carrier protein] reductase
MGVGQVSFGFTGSVVVVTGAARGIGAEIARQFSQWGATVFAADRDELEDPVAGTPLRLDVSDTDAVTAAVDSVISQAGRIDVLVNNAGNLRDAVVWKLTDEDWESVLATHAGGTFRMTRAVVPHLRAQGGGRIVNITSYTGLRGNIGQANYATAKAGIIGFTKTTAKELARFNITVNAISPNAETRMVTGIPEEKKAELRAAIPLGRFAAPSEMVPAIGFLASEQASYVTGVVLPVDGGISI